MYITEIALEPRLDVGLNNKNPNGETSVDKIEFFCSSMDVEFVSENSRYYSCNHDRRYVIVQLKGHDALVLCAVDVLTKGKPKVQPVQPKGNIQVLFTKRRICQMINKLTRGINIGLVLSKRCKINELKIC